MQHAPLPRRPLPRRAASNAASALTAPVVKEAGRGCRAGLKEDCKERSGLAGVLTVQAGCSDTSMPPAGVCKLVSNITTSLAAPAGNGTKSMALGYAGAPLGLAALSLSVSVLDTERRGGPKMS